jgi:hypothetical protein
MEGTAQVYKITLETGDFASQARSARPTPYRAMILATADNPERQ